MERMIPVMRTSEERHAPRPTAVVMWDAVDDAVRAASGDARLIALLRLLSEACDAVDPTPSLCMPDLVTWSTRGGNGETFRVTVESPRHRISGWIEADVIVRSDADRLGRLGLTRDDTLGSAMRIMTRIPLGGDVRDHVSDRTIPILGAYARACAGALDGSRPAMGEDELRTALGVLVHEAHGRHVAVEGNDPGGRWTTNPLDVILRHAGETPLEPGTVTMCDDLMNVAIDAPTMPPYAMMHVNDEGVVTIRRSEDFTFLSDDPAGGGAIATLRAVARLQEAMGESGS